MDFYGIAMFRTGPKKKKENLHMNISLALSYMLHT